MPAKPESVARLEAIYGGPSSSGFGSAIFFRALDTDDDLEQAALSTYRTFVGELWDRFGEEAWMAPWRPVYERPAHADHQIEAELQAI